MQADVVPSKDVAERIALAAQDYWSGYVRTRRQAAFIRAELQRVPPLPMHAGLPEAGTLAPSDKGCLLVKSLSHRWATWSFAWGPAWTAQHCLGPTPAAAQSVAWHSCRPAGRKTPWALRCDSRMRHTQRDVQPAWCAFQSNTGKGWSLPSGASIPHLRAKLGHVTTLGHHKPHAYLMW